MGRDRIIGVIGARAGSKRLPGKNRQEVGGKPLYVRAVEAALDSGVVDHLVLSTDDEEIMTAAQEIPGLKLTRRPPKLADGRTPMWRVLEELLPREEEEHGPFGSLIMLSPCHPFRTAKHVREAFEIFVSTRAESLVSLTPFPAPPGLALRIEDGWVRRDWKGLVRSDEHPTAYYPNGAVIIMRLEALRHYGHCYTKHAAAYELPWPYCLDIDETADLELARRLAEGLRLP